MSKKHVVRHKRRTIDEILKAFPDEPRPIGDDLRHLMELTDQRALMAGLDGRGWREVDIEVLAGSERALKHPPIIEKSSRDTRRPGGMASD